MASSSRNALALLLLCVAFFCAFHSSAAEAPEQSGEKQVQPVKQVQTDERGRAYVFTEDGARWVS